jgi:TPR repeat protein
MAATLQEGIALYNEKKFEEAYEVFYPLAAYERNAEAQFYLGMMYHDGEGVEKDIDKAIGWWKKAMREGHQEAAYSLSEINTSTKTTF